MDPWISPLGLAHLKHGTESSPLAPSISLVLTLLPSRWSRFGFSTDLFCFGFWLVRFPCPIPETTRVYSPSAISVSMAKALPCTHSSHSSSSDLSFLSQSGKSWSICNLGFTIHPTASSLYRHQATLLYINQRGENWFPKIELFD